MMTNCTSISKLASIESYSIGYCTIFTSRQPKHLPQKPGSNHFATFIFSKTLSKF